MIWLVIFLTSIVWFALQHRPAKRAVWEARWRAWQPYLGWWYRDARAAFRTVFVDPVKWLWRHGEHKEQARAFRQVLDDELDELLRRKGR